MRSKVKKLSRRFETVPLAKVPHNNGEDPAVRKPATKEEPYAVPVMGEVEVLALKRKPGH